MLFSQKREDHRQFFIDVWQKFTLKQPLEPLETMVSEVIILHPEYHRFLTPNWLDKDYMPEMGETNPFLHLGLHIALREQITTDRPQGIKAVYQQLLFTGADVHQVEHRMLECLAEMLWMVQRYQLPPNEEAYLTCLKKIKL